MTEPTTSPFAEPSPLPHGLPDWSGIAVSTYRDAIVEAMASQRREIMNITRVRSMATFENTLEAWERSGQPLDRALSAFWVIASADSTTETQQVEEELAPLLAAHGDAILLDSMLFARVTQLQNDPALVASLTDEQRYLLHRRHSEMVHAGAALAPEAKAEIGEINARLASLATEFDKRLLADTNARAVVFSDPAELAGLSDGEIAVARTAATERGHDGSYLLNLPVFSGHPALADMTDAEARALVMERSLGRSEAGANETASVLLETVRLRARRAEVLGFASHAAVITDDETAGSPEAVEDMLRRLATPTAINAAREKSERAAVGSSDGGFRASDWAHAAEIVRARDYDIDTAALRPYFEADAVLADGVFFAATQLYGITFTERPDLPAYHPDVRIFEVFEADGTAIGLFLLDLYTRESKRGGAWMNDVVAPNTLLGTSAVVTNNLNVPRPANGPTLLTFDEVSTLFHEFGHALHGLFARATYPHLSGTNVFRDFVEYPSQVNEMWMLWPEVLTNYARHYETGEPLDPAIGDKLRAAAAFDQGFATSEYLQAAWLDQAWHTLSSAEAAAVTDVAAFESAALEAIGLRDEVIPPRYRSTYFQHVFSGGYSAGYYSYVWSEVLDADTVAWFESNGGLTRENGELFRRGILQVAGTGDPLAAFEAFRGRAADIAPLLVRRGLSD